MSLETVIERYLLQHLPGCWTIEGLFFLPLAVTGSANAQDRPNVVTMPADNVGYGDKAPV